MSYRFRIAQQEYVSHHPSEILTLVHDAVTQIPPSRTAFDLHDGHSSLLVSILPLVCDLIVRHADIIIKYRAKQVEEEFPSYTFVIQKALNSLLGTKAQSGTYIREIYHVHIS